MPIRPILQNFLPQFHIEVDDNFHKGDTQMYKFNSKFLLIKLTLLFLGCASFNQSLNPNNVLAKVCQLMHKPIPSTSPNIWIVNSPYKLANLYTKVDKNFLQKLNNGDMPAGACILGDIFLVKNSFSESLMAHEMAHYMGADEQEAERVATNFSHTLVFRPWSPDGEWGSFAMHR